MTIEEAKKVLEEIYFAGTGNGGVISAILIGKSGVGKTEGHLQLAKKLAEKTGKELIILDDVEKVERVMAAPDKYFVDVEFLLTQSSPEDFMGMPRDEKDYIVYKPLAWARVLSRCSGILFLDEFTNVQRLDVQSAVLKILLEKRVGFTKMCDNVFVLAAGNSPEDSELAIDRLPEPIRRGRVVTLKVSPPTMVEWIDYMNNKYGEEWDKRIGAFLYKFPEKFYEKVDKGDDGYSPIASPRTWSKIAITSKRLSEENLEKFMYGMLSKETASIVMSFLNTKVPDISELDEDPTRWRTLGTDSRYFLILEVSNMEPKEVVKHEKFLTYLSDTDREWIVLLFMFMGGDDKKREVAYILKDKAPKVFKALLESSILSKRLS